MELVNGLFAFLTLIFFILLIVGLVKPSLVKMPSRGKAFIVFFATMIISSIAFNASMSDEQKTKIEQDKLKAELQMQYEEAKKTENINPTHVSDVSQQTEQKIHKETPSEEIETKVTLTNQQKNAVRSAEQYLTISGFSREGLIQQLSASAGDGYNTADATIAVDSLNIDWNQEAVKSAKQYLELQGFSCNGLIQQLSSSAGDKYTVKQATYGA
ncbi:MULTISPECIES: Ltp family lipoprotein [Acinetobacter]|jgi:membrane-associated HD superfamily phosphohydrolase|uniref:Ltp family lipoprotein n=1 Tax=Acinetobacter TaxID=469 RepID=UPI0022E5AF33|nr:MULTISPECIES: Ltp family lipoprotein [Acinetobacter]MDI1222797.1 Ltp family lipoprotein [Acinetobacter sp.]